MVIKYTIPELNAIGEMVLLQECISRMPQYQAEPQYHQVYLPDTTTGMVPSLSTRETPLPNSISADNFLRDYAKFHNRLDQSIQLNRDASWQQQHVHMMQQQRQDEQLADSVAEFFRKAQQNFHPQKGGAESATRVRRLSEVEAELLGQLKGHLHV